MNGLPLKHHMVELSDDGIVLNIGKLWRLDGWVEDGAIQFRSTTFQNDMEARKEVWTRSSVDAPPRLEHLRLLGYAGGDALSGGLQIPEHIKNSKDAEDVALLTTLVAQWREVELCRVRPCKVVPDFVNRAQTGLGVELLHYIAGSIRDRGFQTRRGLDGHDIPVLVRQPPGNPAHDEALSFWRARVAEEEGFPPVRIGDEELFTSLGNGHFFQALNLFETEWRSINQDGCYSIGEDTALANAISSGVPSIVLRSSTPRPVRAKIAVLLNSKREFFWALKEDGTVDVTQMQESISKCSQFEWLSRGMDAVHVNCLVRTHLGIKESKRQQM